MLAMIAITAAMVFFVLWGMGYLDDLQRRARARKEERRGSRRPQQEPKTRRRNMAERLEVFKRFIEDLPEDESE
jgi:hypothetical protein